MFRKMTLLFFSLVVSATLHAQTTSTVYDTVSSFFKEAEVSTKNAVDLWKKNIYGPILFVHPFTRQAYANFPDTGGILKKKGRVYTGILPSNVIMGNASISWGGITWAMMFVLPPGYLFRDKYDRINLMTHELFHVSQGSLGFPRRNDVNNVHLDKKEGRIYLRLELEALKKALSTNRESEILIHLTNAMIFRQYRFYLFPGTKEIENILDLNEGISEYTGLVMAGRSDKGSKSHLAKKIDTFLLNPTYIRTFPYYNIPVYGHLLRSIDKHWNLEIDSNTNLSDFFTRKFGLAIPPDFKTISTLAMDYDYGNILIKETQREKEAEIQILRYKKRFLEQPVFEIQFYRKSVSFDSRYVTALEDKGVVYPTMTASDQWGILKIESGGGLINNKRNTVTISVPLEIRIREAKGDGWTLSLNPGYEIQKDPETGNYMINKIVSTQNER